jgi:Na+-driven multidrug efflux pump
VLYNVLLGGVLVLLIQLASGHVLGLFLPKNSPALAVAEHINLIVAWTFVFFGVPLTLFGVVRATGAVVAPLIIFFVTLILFRFPFAMLLMERWGADAIWWSFVLAAVLTTLLALAYYRYGDWRSARMIPSGAAATAEISPN